MKTYVEATDSRVLLHYIFRRMVVMKRTAANARMKNT